MCKRTLTAIMIGFVLSNCLAQTDISEGDISGTWSLTNSPYHIDGEITIPDGQTLTIEPGVQIIFTGHYKFNIQGRLLAVGTEQDSIVFTAQDHETGWHGLKFDNTPGANDSSLIAYSRLEYGKSNTGTGEVNRCGGAVFIRCDKVRISHCLFQHNYSYHPVLQQTGGGAIAVIGKPIIEYCEIKNNDSAFGGAFIIWYSPSSNAQIRNNYIHHNTGHGTINIGGGASPLLENNLIVNNHSNTHGVIHFSNDGGRAVLINNTIANNSCEGPGGAIFVNHGLAPLFMNNIISGNSPAQVRLEAPSSLHFYHCLIDGGESGFSGAAFTGTCQNCLDSDPCFSDTVNHDYHLSSTSPCIGAGADSIQLGNKWYDAPLNDFHGNGRPDPAGSGLDIGTFENVLGGPITHVEEIMDRLPQTCELMQNYPNPFNPATTIHYQLGKSSHITLEIMNLRGQRILTLVDEIKTAGDHSVNWNGTNQFGQSIPSGVYLYYIKSGDFIQFRKLMFIQ
ncbi:right-handed parallel beta-helix repeat-containing protein [bacterium]